MKQFFSTSYSAKLANLWLLLLRLCAAGFMLTHGIPKLQNLIAGNYQIADPLGIGPMYTLVLAVLTEVVCSVLLALGLATRFASLGLAITMAVAAFMRHAVDPFNQKELALVYLLIYITLIVFGPGRYSLDARITRGGGKKTSSKSKNKF